MIELRKKLKQAIDVEDYELAARLRDQIRTLEQESGK
jgi:protein-arginine kinase activator protein McsA